MNNWWEVNANYVVETYGGCVDWDEKYYVCPECQELIYEEDWDEDEMGAFICPICEFTEG